MGNKYSARLKKLEKEINPPEDIKAVFLFVDDPNADGSQIIEEHIEENPGAKGAHFTLFRWGGTGIDYEIQSELEKLKSYGIEESAIEEIVSAPEIAGEDRAGDRKRIDRSDDESGNGGAAANDRDARSEFCRLFPAGR